jgi:hypothetical protein
VWARAEDASPARVDLVLLGPEIAERLRADAAHMGEWSVADPHPTASPGCGGGASR